MEPNPMLELLDMLDQCGQWPEADAIMERACGEVGPERAGVIAKILWYGADKVQRDDFPQYFDSKWQRCNSFCDNVLPSTEDPDALVYLWQVFDSGADPNKMTFNLLQPGGATLLSRAAA